MLGFAWLTLRQAREAIRTGRLEEAQRLLGQPGVQGHRGANPLLARLARGYALRGERVLRHDDIEGAWRDLLNAEQVEVGGRHSERLRQALARLGITEARALFQSGDLERANEVILRLRQRGVHSPELQVLESAVKGWLEARTLADRGEFALALESVERLGRLILGPVGALEALRQDLAKGRQDFASRLARLHEAVEAGRWREVVEVAEQVLSVAPQHAEARKARTRAWKAIEPVTVAMRSPDDAQPQPQAAGDAATAGSFGRYMLWIDGVGGYLVCLGPRLTFGHAFLDPHVDIPLVADVSRLHATLTRDSEGYVLEAVRPVQVNGQTTTRALLRPGDRVTLGTSCQFQFHQPVAVSGTARIDLVSGHRLPVAVDGIILMADTLVMDKVAQAHIVVPDLKQPVVLFRHKDGLGLRHSGRLSLDGEKAAERTLLPPHAVLHGEDIAFALEPVEARVGQG